MQHLLEIWYPGSRNISARDGPTKFSIVVRAASAWIDRARCYNTASAHITFHQYAHWTTLMYLLEDATKFSRYSNWLQQLVHVNVQLYSIVQLVQLVQVPACRRDSIYAKFDPIEPDHAMPMHAMHAMTQIYSST